ncbi:acetyltransferase [Dissulfurirhabdus thermomarina]|uniref:Acetyltransferase n=1 Tax=Dissulfurirhabdus thermomarina TaxID=1765737 RepID=A0A6N9TN00_DISTH|nr:acetyltransferase [Dissulfurirhabdus thermomarina]NDY42625.1 acetyltransferase [Dissulfurirhabdus thermomarina]NMX23064.1 acetyltransferase [Dissulfurirhabdus thermomarina]
MEPPLYEVFNGDADGICALHQLRLFRRPRKTVPVTGVKRDIALLERLRGLTRAEVLVLDVSLDKNRPALLDLLANGCRVEYFDHHYAGEIPDHPNLVTHIDPSPTTNTSLIVDRHLGGPFTEWALVGAYGDNLHDVADAMGRGLGLEAAELERLRLLGELLNYNAYGRDPADLHFRPETLLERMEGHRSPSDFLAAFDLVARLREAREADLRKAASAAPVLSEEWGAVYVLPDAAWARRVSGDFANRLAAAAPGRAHAVLTDTGDGAFVVSVRAPLARRKGADALCRQFPTGGGRAAAAGINRLPADRLSAFLDRFRAAFGPAA